MQSWSPDAGSLALPVLRRLYKLRKISPVDVVRAVYRRIAASPHKEAWITLVDESAAVAAAEALEKRAAEHARHPLPLYGIPFAVKDNIDVADLPTTAGCREYLRTAATSATAVARLVAAGAIVIGKTNLDQFATGLTGVVSSYGICKNPFDPAYVSGGSSAGSALAVAAGLVSFSLGTDTAGSGRIPAGFNNIVGLKPTRGLVPTRGVLPACRSLDCVSVFSLTAADASEILSVIKGYDHADTYSRAEADGDSASLLRVPVTSFRFGVVSPAQLDDGAGVSAETLDLYHAAAKHLESLGGKRFEVDIAPLLATGKLLYEGPWIAERLAAVSEFMAQNPSAVSASTRNAILAANNFSAVDTFRAMYQLEALRRQAAPLWSQIDMLLIPTALEVPTIEASSADPRGVSARLGRLTNFVNLLDLCAVSVPAGFRSNQLPFGVTLLGPAFTDASLADLAERFHRLHKITLGATGQGFPEVESMPGGFIASSTERFAEKTIAVAVVGAHLSGQPLNHQLTQLSARLARRCRTAPIYKLFALDTTPPKPGMVRLGADEKGGAAIDLEVWDLPEKNMGAFMQLVGSPLCIGTITLESGESVKGFLCEIAATQNARDITHFGGWLHYLARAS